MTNKTTYADTLSAILEMNILTDDHKANVEKLLESCKARAKHSTKKAEKIIEENSKIANEIIASMKNGVKYRTTELGKLTPTTSGYSTSKLVSITKNFDNRVNKISEKGVTLYSLAD